MDIWEMIFDQRRQLTGVLETLDNAQWDTPSLCTAWTVRDVVGHLVSFHELGTPRVMLRMVLNGFNFNKMNEKLAKDFGVRSSQELLGLLRKHTEGRWTPPGLGPAAPLCDVVLHTEDICRPLGIKSHIDAGKVRAALDFLVSRKGGVVAKPAWRQGLYLAPHDIDWSWGSGPKVNGTALDIVVAIAGRQAGLDRLTGDGMDQLRARMSATA